MDDKNILMQPNNSCGFTISCPFCLTRFEKKSDELELENLICLNCTEHLPLRNLVFLYADGTPIEEDDLSAADHDEMKNYGTSIKAILSHKGKEDDLDLANSIGFQLMEKIGVSGIDSLSDEEKYFYAVYELDSEVNNGGYLQYFDNSSGDLAYLIIDALQSIGLNKVLQITKEALDIYGGDVSKNQNVRMEEIAKLTNNYEDNLWNECDSQFYDIEDENIGILLMNYAEKNQNKFEF